MEVYQIQSGDGSCFEFSGNISMQGVNKEQNTSGQGPPALSAPVVFPLHILEYLRLTVIQLK